MLFAHHTKMVRNCPGSEVEGGVMVRSPPRRPPHPHHTPPHLSFPTPQRRTVGVLVIERSPLKGEYRNSYKEAYGTVGVMGAMIAGNLPQPVAEPRSDAGSLKRIDV
jgi:hypothetical protein